MSERRSEPRREVCVVAELIMHEKVERVVVGELSMGGCTLRLGRPLNVGTRIVFRLFGDQGNQAGLEPYGVISATVRRYRQSMSDPSVHYASVKFNHPARADQGVARILYPERFEKTVKRVEVHNASLRGVFVQCYLCNQADIPFYLMRARSMQMQANIFSIPSYTKPVPGKEFVDYNQIQVHICPKCLFASNDVGQFRRLDGENPDLIFDNGSFSKPWMEKLPVRQQMIKNHEKGLFGESRILPQALLSYDLAIHTVDELYAFDGNVEHQRKAIAYLMFMGEILMMNGRRPEAEAKIQNALDRAVTIFSRLNNEASIRAALLISMVSLYFGNNAEVSKYMQFLAGYDREGKLVAGTPEHRVLAMANKQINYAWQERARYSHKELKTFHLNE